MKNLKRLQKSKTSRFQNSDNDLIDFNKIAEEKKEQLKKKN